MSKQDLARIVRAECVNDYEEATMTDGKRSSRNADGDMMGPVVEWAKRTFKTGEMARVANHPFKGMLAYEREALIHAYLGWVAAGGEKLPGVTLE